MRNRFKESYLVCDDTTCHRCRSPISGELKTYIYFTKKDMGRLGHLCKKCIGETINHRLPSGQANPNRPTKQKH